MGLGLAGWGLPHTEQQHPQQATGSAGVSALRALRLPVPLTPSSSGGIRTYMEPPPTLTQNRGAGAGCTGGLRCTVGLGLQVGSEEHWGASGELHVRSEESQQG